MIVLQLVGSCRVIVKCVRLDIQMGYILKSISIVEKFFIPIFFLSNIKCSGKTTHPIVEFWNSPIQMEEEENMVTDT